MLVLKPCVVLCHTKLNFRGRCRKKKKMMKGFHPKTIDERKMRAYAINCISLRVLKVKTWFFYLLRT